MKPVLLRLLAAAARRVTSLSYLDSATSTATTITVPSGVQTGDVGILLDEALNFSGSPPSATVPSGWTSLVDTAGTITRQIISAKVLSSSDAGTTLTGMDGAVGESKSLLVIRPNAPATAFAAYSTAGEITANNPAAQVVAASGGVAPLVVVAGYTSTGTLSGVSFSPSQDGTITNGTTQELRYKFYSGSPADVTVDMADSGSINWMQSLYLQVS